MSDLYNCVALPNEDEFYYTRGNSLFFTFPQPDSRRSPYCNIYLVQAAYQRTTGGDKYSILRTGFQHTNVYSNDRKRLSTQGLLTTLSNANHFTLREQTIYPVRCSSNFNTIEICLEDELGNEISPNEISRFNCLFRVEYLETNVLRDEILESYLPVNRLLN